MQLFCLQLEASRLLLGFFAYNFIGAFTLTVGAFLLMVKACCLQRVSQMALQRCNVNIVSRFLG